MAHPCIPIPSDEGDTLAQGCALATLESLGVGVLTTDANGRVTYLNPVAETMTGWSRHMAKSLPLAQVFPMSAVPAGGSALVPHAPMRTLVRRNGTRVEVDFATSPLRDAAGATIGSVLEFRDIGQARALTLRMSHMAHHDGLTGLPNRALLQDRLAQATDLANRHGQTLALLFLDIDRFKHINDTLGHETGDRVLVSFGERLRSCVRTSDTVCRYGGDEFVILLPDLVHARDARICADKLLRALRDPHDIDGRMLTVTASIGIALWSGAGARAELLVANADAAMYEAKSSGRDSYSFSTGCRTKGASSRSVSTLTTE